MTSIDSGGGAACVDFVQPAKAMTAGAISQSVRHLRPAPASTIFIFVIERDLRETGRDMEKEWGKWDADARLVEVRGIWILLSLRRRVGVC
jgi:hypothetical protein